MKNEIILFTDGDINIEVQINPEQVEELPVRVVGRVMESRSKF